MIFDFQPFGRCLLDDPNGVKLANIYATERGHPTKINDRVFSEWVVGRGKRPVTWRSLLECLREVELFETMKDLLGAMEDGGMEATADGRGEDTLSELPDGMIKSAE